jgi:hypothetical protein
MKRSYLQQRNRALQLALPLVFLTQGLAWGQEQAGSFQKLGQLLIPGDRVQLIDSGGNKIQGKVENISASSLALKRNKGRLILPEHSVWEIRKRRPDPWWNGALIGGGIGAAAGLIVVHRECGGSDPECSAIAVPTLVLPGIGIGAAAGALIDFSVKKFDTVFRASGTSNLYSIRASPFMTRQQKGITLSLSF